MPIVKSPRANDCSMDAQATCTNCGSRPRPRAIIVAISTSKPRTRVGSAASASTNGAPPSASPPQRRGTVLVGAADVGDADGSAQAHVATSHADIDSTRVAIRIMERGGGEKSARQGNL